MRRTTLLMALAVLFTAPTAAVVQNGTSPSNQVGDGEMGTTAAPSGGQASQSFGSGDGPTFHMTLAPVNTSGTITEDRVSDVTRGARYVEFTGHMQFPTPCHSLNTSAAVDGNTVTLTVDSTPGDGPCVQQVVMKQYRLDLQADEPFQLEVRHGDTTVTTMNTTGYPPEEKKEAGLIERLAQLLRSLF